MSLVNALNCGACQSASLNWFIRFGPIHIAPCGQIPTIKIAEPFFIPVSFEFAIALHHTTDGYNLVQTPLKNHFVAKLYGFIHGGTLGVAANKRHTISKEAIG